TTTVAGNANITIAVSDNGVPPLKTLQTFVLTVQEPATPLFGNRSPIFISDNAAPTPPPSAATPYPSTISVSGLVGKVADVSVTLLGVSHPTPDDIGVMLVGPGTSPGKVVMMRNAGAGTALNNAVFIFRDNANSSLPSTG